MISDFLIESYQSTSDVNIVDESIPAKRNITKKAYEMYLRTLLFQCKPAKNLLVGTEQTAQTVNHNN
jgi:hypothetical protein